MTETALGKTSEPTVEQREARAPSNLRWNPGLVVGIVLFIAVAVVSWTVPLINVDAASELSKDTNLPPSGSHWLGTDLFGRDMLARAFVATQLSLVMTLGATAISVVFGVLIGTTIRFAPTRVREFSLRAIEIAVSYPSLLVAVVIAAVLGAGPWQLVLAIGLSGIPSMARLASTLAAAVYERDYVTTARLVGVPKRLMIWRHLLPNMAEPLLVQIASVFAFGLIAISALSFVGLGVQTPDYDLGRLLADGLPAIYTRPLEIAGPTLMIVLVSLSAMLIGDGLAAGADPRLQSQSRAAMKKPPHAPVAGIDESSSLVSVRNLTVSKESGEQLVKGISFEVRRNEILGFVGESGSGKSLTAMALAQLLPEGLSAAADELRILDHSMLGTVPNRTLATTLALIYQDPGTTFNPALRMGSQLTEVLRVHRGFSAKKARQSILEMLEKVRITDPQRLLDSRPYELSGGMRQRAMIASALVVDPALIIADEPTTALDVTVQAEILREFKRIRQERTTSLLFISHDIGVVEALCDRVIIMKDGELVEEVTADQLREKQVTHPYTRMLLEAVPRLDERARGEK